MSPSVYRPAPQPGAPRTLAVLLLFVAAATLVTAQSNGNSGISNRAYLPLLLERPGEPLYYGAKGPREEVTFQLPDNYVPNRYKAKAVELASRFGAATRVTVPAISVPDISLPMQLGRRDPFSLFIPLHRQMAKRLVEIFMGMRTYEDFVSAGAFCRENVNPYLFSYAMSIAMLHRNDTAGAPLPSMPSIFPEKYFDGAIFNEARRESNLADQENRLPIEIGLDWTATDLEPEHRVAYWREDVGNNANHWSWHLTYPFDGPREIVAKDRRGEVFFYFHQQMIARYNFERFSNGLPRVQDLSDLRARVPEAYFSKLDSLVASRVYPPRPAGMLLSDIRREDYQLNFDIGTMERWRERIFQAIHSGRVQSENGSMVPLDERTGIDILGNMVEASPILSINPNLYGDLHNAGHMLLGLCHDPDHRHLESFSPVGDPTTSMRDPVFYRWHSFIDTMFHQHKQTLTPYTVQQLGFDGIRVTGATLQTQGANRPNEFNTFWQQSDVDLSQGLDFVPRGPVFVRFTHLQHAPFSYRIQVANSGQRRTGTVRIYLAPEFDERGRPLTFREQRLFFIELDKFQHDFRPGNNTIQRSSVDSTLTVPWDRTFRNLSADLSQPQDQREQLNYCGCGWPHHLLLPKGTSEGMRAHLFVMVSNYADDRVDNPPSQNVCNRGHSYCGLFRQRYPDRRPMGYPFDRLPRQGAVSTAQFLTPNMIITPVTIRFSGQTVRPPNTATTFIGPTTRIGGNANANRPPNNVAPANNARTPPNNARAPVNNAPPPGRAGPPARGAPPGRAAPPGMRLQG